MQQLDVAQSDLEEVSASRVRPRDRGLDEVPELVHLMALLQFGEPQASLRALVVAVEVAVLLLHGTQKPDGFVDERHELLSTTPDGFPSDRLQRLVQIGVGEKGSAEGDVCLPDEPSKVVQHARRLHELDAVRDRRSVIEVLPVTDEPIAEIDATNVDGAASSLARGCRGNGK